MMAFAKSADAVGRRGAQRSRLLSLSWSRRCSLSAACPTEADVDLATYVEQTEPADVLYNQGLANLNAGRLKEASRKFDAVDRQHPYSEYARKAMVMGAFANYRQGKYDEAINAAKRYLTLYPVDRGRGLRAVHHRPELFPPDPRRDAGPEGIAPRHRGDGRGRRSAGPNSEYVEDAKAKIRFARDQLAGKEMQIGRYYLERREYIAAIKRFRYVVENYSNTRHVEEALARLTEAYYAMGLTSEAQTAAAVLGHNYPGQPVVQGFLHAAADRRPRAARECRLVDFARPAS